MVKEIVVSYPSEYVFLGSRNVCMAMAVSRINACPVLDEDELGVFHPPDDCPLKSGRIIVNHQKYSILKESLSNITEGGEGGVL